MSSFRAATIHRDSFTGQLSVIEYRVPDYTYVVNVPIEVPGLNDAGLKQWDELFASLPQNDQAAWVEMDKLLNQLDLQEPIRRKLKVRFPNLDMKKLETGEIKPSEEQERAIQAFSSEALTQAVIEALHKTSVSPQSKERIETYIRKRMVMSNL